MAMSKGRLTADQIELLHHVELAQAGWQDRLVDQLVTSAVLAASAPLWLSNSKARFLTGAVATIVWSIAVMVFGRRSEHVRTWAAFSKTERLLKWLAGAAAAVVCSLIAQALWIWFSE